jgi:hypothetical protein
VKSKNIALLSIAFPWPIGHNIDMEEDLKSLEFIGSARQDS